MSWRKNGNFVIFDGYEESKQRVVIYHEPDSEAEPHQFRVTSFRKDAREFDWWHWSRPQLAAFAKDLLAFCESVTTVNTEEPKKPRHTIVRRRGATNPWANVKFIKLGVETTDGDEIYLIQDEDDGEYEFGCTANYIKAEDLRPLAEALMAAVVEVEG